MANGRNGKSRRDTQRDGTGFVALPTVMLDSAAYQSLGYSARALLVELARQLGKDNNGRLLATEKVLGARGWNSPHVIANALRELGAAGLVYRTVMGRRPHRASWYAVTWYALADHPGYDAGAFKAFRRGAYLSHGTTTPVARDNTRPKNTCLTAGSAVVGFPIAAVSAVEKHSTTADSAAINGTFGTSPTADSADHLDIAICTRSKAKQGKQAGGATAAPASGNVAAWSARVVHPTPADILAMKPPSSAWLRDMFGNLPRLASPPSIVAQHWLQEVA